MQQLRDHPTSPPSKGTVVKRGTAFQNYYSFIHLPFALSLHDAEYLSGSYRGHVIGFKMLCVFSLPFTCMIHHSSHSPFSILEKIARLCLSRCALISEGLVVSILSIGFLGTVRYGLRQPTSPSPGRKGSSYS